MLQTDGHLLFIYLPIRKGCGYLAMSGRGYPLMQQVYSTTPPPFLYLLLLIVKDIKFNIRFCKTGFKLIKKWLSKLCLTFPICSGYMIEIMKFSLSSFGVSIYLETLSICYIFRYCYDQVLYYDRILISRIKLSPSLSIIVWKSWNISVRERGRESFLPRFLTPHFSLLPYRHCVYVNKYSFCAQNTFHKHVMVPRYMWVKIFEKEKYITL